MPKAQLLVCLIALSGATDAALVERAAERPLKFREDAENARPGTATNFGVSVVNARAVAVGQGNTAANSIGVIKPGASVRGSVSINARAENSTAVAIGEGNTAVNEIGTIGGR
jgi:hypothetical protein